MEVLFGGYINIIYMEFSSGMGVLFGGYINILSIKNKVFSSFSVVCVVLTGGMNFILQFKELFEYFRFITLFQRN